MKGPPSQNRYGSNGLSLWQQAPPVGIASVAELASAYSLIRRKCDTSIRGRRRKNIEAYLLYTSSTWTLLHKHTSPLFCPNPSWSCGFVIYSPSTQPYHTAGGIPYANDLTGTTLHLETSRNTLFLQSHRGPRGRVWLYFNMSHIDLVVLSPVYNLAILISKPPNTDVARLDITSSGRTEDGRQTGGIICSTRVCSPRQFRAEIDVVLFDLR